MTSNIGLPTLTETMANTLPGNLLDVEHGIGMMGSDASLRKILETVTVSLSSNIQEIGAFLDAGDVLAANRLLHAIKGYAPIFCTDEAVLQITHVESISKTASVSIVAPLFSTLRPALEQLVNEIDNYLATGQIATIR